MEQLDDEMTESCPWRVQQSCSTAALPMWKLLIFPYPPIPPMCNNQYLLDQHSRLPNSPVAHFPSPVGHCLTPQLMLSGPSLLHLSLSTPEEDKGLIQTSYRKMGSSQELGRHFLKRVSCWSAELISRNSISVGFLNGVWLGDLSNCLQRLQAIPPSGRPVKSGTGSLEKLLKNKPALLSTIKFGSVQINSQF